MGVRKAKHLPNEIILVVFIFKLQFDTQMLSKENTFFLHVGPERQCLIFKFVC